MKTLALLVLALGALAQTPDLDGRRIVDLTHPFGPATLYWPTSPSKFRLDSLASGKTEGGYFYAANSLSTPEHGGTHLDAPRRRSPPPAQSAARAESARSSGPVRRSATSPTSRPPSRRPSAGT
jgi:hypothetical protein